MKNLLILHLLFRNIISMCFIICPPTSDFPPLNTWLLWTCYSLLPDTAVLLALIRDTVSATPIPIDDWIRMAVWTAVVAPCWGI